MADYIRRILAKAQFTGNFQSEYPTALIHALLDDVPSEDVRPVVRGHIEEDENTYLFCSECNCNITLAAYETPDNRLVLRPNFCPNCGALMEES